jgi:hypothetical protein
VFARTSCFNASSFRDAPLGAGPKSITPAFAINYDLYPAFQIDTGIMDSGQPLRGFRNDERGRFPIPFSNDAEAVIASEAKQSIGATKGKRWIASSRSSSQ